MGGDGKSGSTSGDTSNLVFIVALVIMSKGGLVGEATKNLVLCRPDGGRANIYFLLYHPVPSAGRSNS